MDRSSQQLDLDPSNDPHFQVAVSFVLPPDDAAAAAQEESQSNDRHDTPADS